MHAHVAIIGTGFGGLGAAIRLRQAGVDDFVLLERADDVGGTWRDNTYPGCACDVQSHLYSLSFAPNPDWSHSFSRQPEIWDYLRRVARDHGLLPHVRFRHEVLAAEWDDDALLWHVETSAGEWTADLLVMATGPLSDPVIPELAGLETFRGAAFHSARWNHGVELAGKRVAVVGTGASAVQFVPAIQPVVERLYLFQRTAPWVMPRRDRALGPVARAVYRRVPLAQRLVRQGIYAARELMVVAFRRPRLARRAHAIALRHLEAAVSDPALRARLTPDYTLGCKRVAVSDDYLPALTRPNVAVVTAGIAEVRAGSIVDGDGVERPADVIVFGTGFRPTDPPLAAHVRGRGGRTLRDVWAGSPKAHLGTTVAGFPNLFILLGPNTGLGHNSVVLMIEAQLEHLVGAVQYLARRGLAAIEPRAEAQAAWVADVERRMRGTVWVDGGCASWYLDRAGRNSALWPDFTGRFRRRVARFDPADYVAIPAPREAPAVAAPA
jgi:cation diffusion facilitator CzcD-associated flavoprotein CzcO